MKLLVIADHIAEEIKANPEKMVSLIESDIEQHIKDNCLLLTGFDVHAVSYAVPELFLLFDLWPKRVCFAQQTTDLDIVRLQRWDQVF